MMTAATVRCRHCGAVGIRHFTRRLIACQDAPTLDVISCLICGDWLVSRPAEGRPMQRAVDRGRLRSTHYADNLTPCATVGCPRHISPERVAAGQTRCSYCCKVHRAHGHRAAQQLIKEIKS